MHLSATSTRAGFSLVEATVAAAILLATCLMVSTTLINALGAGRLVDGRVAVGEALASERDRLAVLPYYAPSAAPSLLAQVFPHAQTGSNTTAAFYRDDADGPVFVTESTLQGVDLRCEARFVRRTAAGWSALPAAAVAGWSVGQSDALPAATVQLRLVATAGARTSSVQVRLGALSPTVEKAAYRAVVRRGG